MKSKRRFRIRHCDDNKAAWLLVMLCAKNGSEYDSFGSYTTAMSLDSLLKHAGHLTPQHGEHVELVL